MKARLPIVVFLVPILGCPQGSRDDSVLAAPRVRDTSASLSPRGVATEPGARPAVPTYDSEKTLDPITFARRKAVAAGAHLSMARFMDILLLEQRQICDFLPDGQVGPTPPMSVRCALGPGGRCTKSGTPTEPWEYDEKLWEDPAWQHVEIKYFDGDPYHFSMEWRATDDPHEPCEYTVRAFGDLDDDGVFSTFAQGTNLAPELGEDRPPNPTALE